MEDSAALACYKHFQLGLRSLKQSHKSFVQNYRLYTVLYNTLLPDVFKLKSQQKRYLNFYLEILY